ncbi:arginine repressor [Eubacterium pyruvativorans]|uniref:arginine repressor n=1 Tax=Eubacterium pyruvativorans TaxID=155865 RepID=UPI001563BAB8|nr:arginine repressor [Eubacterium pyruvativorans]
MRYSRQNKILELIGKYEIETQDKLAALLREEGFEVTQATISRDIKELQLIKVLTPSGKYKYAVSKRSDAPITDRFMKIFRETVISTTSVNNLILIKTLSGCGSAAAEAVDNIGVPYIVGTIAGDNTMLVVVDSEEHVQELLTTFNNMISAKKQEA